MDDFIFAMPEALQDRLDAVSLPPTSQVTLHSHSVDSWYPRVLL